MRTLLHSWRFWMVMAFFGLSGVVVGLYVQNGKINATEREHVKIEAVQQAAANARVAQCLASRPALHRFDEFVSAVLLLHESLVENAKTTLDATPRSSPAYALRLRGYKRLVATIEPIEKARFPIPSVKSCRFRR